MLTEDYKTDRTFIIVIKKGQLPHQN